MKRIEFSIILILFSGLYGLAVAQPQPAPMEALGEVDFQVSCSPEAQAQFNRGLALFHHMTFEEARAAFENAAEADPECAMAHWGVAMTFIRPLRPPLSPEATQQGREAIERARSLGAETEREGAYLGALDAVYADPEMTHPARLQTFEAEMEKLYTAYSDDIDAAALYALSLLGTAPSTDKTLAHQHQAIDILESLRAAKPMHPGAIHYGIHAHDVPPLAQQGEELARGYDRIAPEVSHALHMPSHIFVRLGEWPDAVAWNRRSAQAALDLQADTVHPDYFHAMDYAVYGLLQQGKDGEALNALQEVQTKEAYPNDLAVAYTLAAVPARYALERQQWAEAAALTAREASGVDWDGFPQLEAITHFARGIGAARSGDVGTAGEALQRLEALRERMLEAGVTYWADQIEIQRLAVAAWLAHEDGDDENALALMQASADLERATEKHPVTPGAVLPAQELLGDLLMELNRPAEALEAYGASLEVAPGRFNSLLGAGRAADLAGDAARASAYYTQLMEIAGESARSGLEKAREFLDRD